MLTAQSFFECELRNARLWEGHCGSYVDEMLAGQFPNGSSGRDAFSLAYYPPNHAETLTDFDILPGSTEHIDMLLDLPLPFTEPERQLLGTELVDSMRTELSLSANLLVSYTEQAEDMSLEEIDLPAINLAEPAPTGHDGVEISVDDRVRVLATGDIFRVDGIVYLGYVNREVAEQFAEPGWMLNDATDQDHGRGGLVHAGDCVKIE